MKRLTASALLVALLVLAARPAPAGIMVPDAQPLPTPTPAETQQQGPGSAEDPSAWDALIESLLAFMP